MTILKNCCKSFKVLLRSLAFSIQSFRTNHVDKIPQFLFSRKEKLTEAEKEKLIITGSVNLIGLKGKSKTNSIGNFCRLNWEAHKTDPSAGKKMIIVPCENSFIYFVVIDMSALHMFLFQYP